MLVDITVVLILLLGIVIGSKRGIVKMLAPLASLLCAFVLAMFVSAPVTEYFSANIIEPSLRTAIADTADSIGVQGVLDNLKSFSLPETAITDNLGEIEIPDTELTRKLKSGVLSGITSKIDFASITAIPETISVESLTDKLMQILHEPIQAMLKPICFGILFTVSLILFRIIFNFFSDIISGLKILATVSAVLGGAVGLILAVAISMLALIFIPKFLDNSSDIYNNIKTSLSGTVTQEIVSHLPEVKF